MDKLVIEGGAPLKGTVKIAGAKNAVLPIMAASLLTDQQCVLRGVPDLSDVITMMKILRALGVKCSMDGDTVTIQPKGYDKTMAPYKLVSTMRASVCVLGPLVGRKGCAQVSMPGGCVIGPRPIDLHIKGLKALNIDIDIDHGYVNAKAKKLSGGHVYLGGAFGSSVLATANVMCAAVLAKGRTVIENAACEPEVVDLANVLVKMGARIKGHKSHIIEIEGVKKLNGFEHTIIPDRIEAGTYMIGAAMTGGNVLIKGALHEHLGALIDKLSEAGVKIDKRPGEMRVKVTKRLSPVDVTTLPFPGFPTDLQAQMLALMTVTKGISVITEKIYPDRFMHVSELGRMGANIKIEGASAIVSGVQKLSGAPVMASDLRASAALVLAGLVARGKTEVSRIYHLDRGYEKMEEKMRSLGAKVYREKEV